MPAAKAKKAIPDKFGPTFDGDYPPEMRRQLWPLCCGASILSGFKSVATLTNDELIEQINSVINDAVPDFQVYGYETMRPKLTFLTLNSDQMKSKKIMTAIAKVGFFKVGTAKPRGHIQGFFVRDTSDSWASFDKDIEEQLGTTIEQQPGG